MGIGGGGAGHMLCPSCEGGWESECGPSMCDRMWGLRKERISQI